MTEPVIGIVILNWKKPGETLRCLAAVNRSTYSCWRVVVVENGSQDDSIAVLRQAYPELELLISPENLGYTGGNNLGIQYLLAQGVDYILLLNDDAVLDPNALAALVQAANADPQTGFLGPKVLAVEEPQVLLSAGGLLDKGYLPHNRGMGEIDRGQYDRYFQADFLSGCALLVNRKCIEKIGMLDDDFFVYFEEVEWCYRGVQAGFTIRFVPAARVWHPDTRSRDIDSPSVTYYATRNSLRFAQKHHLGFTTIAALLIQYARRWLSWSLRSKWRQKHSPAQRQALRQAIIDFAVGRVGKRGSASRLKTFVG